MNIIVIGVLSMLLVPSLAVNITLLSVDESSSGVQEATLFESIVISTLLQVKLRLLSLSSSVK